MTVRVGARAGALVVLALLLALAAGASAQAARALVVKPYTVLRLAGTDMYCTAYAQNGVTGVLCLHLPKGPTAKSGKGYEAFATEKGVVILLHGASKPSGAYREPSLVTVTKIAGGAPHGKTVTIGANQVVGVSGTHMAVYATPKVGGDAAIGVIYVDAKLRPVIGSYTISISNRYVTVIEVSGANKTKVVYRHAVY